MFPVQNDPMLRHDRRDKEPRSCCRQARSIMHENVHGMIILDGASAVQYANPAAERILGKRALLIGMPFPFTRRGGESGETTIMTADRGPVTIECWGMETEWEQKPAWLVTLHDVTERKRYEEQLRSSEQQLAEAQKIAHLGSWKRYLDTGKSHWSDEMYRILGLEPGSVPPSQELFLSMVHPDDRKKIAELARDTLIKKKSFSSYLCRIVRPDGTVRILLGQGELIQDPGGLPTMMIGTALDVTEREMMAEEIKKLNTALEARAAELEAANRELETFSYTVCHDLRSPLTNIHGYSQVLAELCSEHLDEPCRRYLQEISRGTERMNELIETLLQFSLLTSRSLALDRINLSEIVCRTASDLHLRDPERRVNFIIQNDVHVQGDEGLLSVVIGNLLGNAWKYTGNRDQAAIEFGAVERKEGNACFVRDNGIGFDAREAKKLFAPFHRSAEATDIQGHGIGLATVKRIIERHGGRVWAEGEPDRGATFFFTLPVP